MQQVAQTALDVRATGQVRTGALQSVAARRLNANHVRTQVGQEAARQTQTLVAEVDDD